MFVVCANCQRHVRESESACPFCRKSIVALDVAPSAKPLRVAFAIAAATAAMGCHNEPAALYGAPPVQMTDASTPPTTPPQPTATETVSPPAPAYGAPPMTKTEDAGPAPVSTTPQVRPLYGAPPAKR